MSNVPFVQSGKVFKIYDHNCTPRKLTMELWTEKGGIFVCVHVGPTELLGTAILTQKQARARADQLKLQMKHIESSKTTDTFSKDSYTKYARILDAIESLLKDAENEGDPNNVEVLKDIYRRRPKSSMAVPMSVQNKKRESQTKSGLWLPGGA